MKNTKESRLNRAIFQYVMECLSEGDLDGLRSLGFDRRDIDKISGVNASDLHRLHGLQFHVVAVQLDHDRFRCFLEHIDRIHEEMRAIEYLVKNDAPAPILRGLYGLGWKECRVYRALHCTESHIGRPREAAPEEAWKVLGAYRSLGKETTDRMTAADWKTLHERTGVPLRLIWQIVSDSARSASNSSRPCSDAQHSALAQ